MNLANARTAFERAVPEGDRIRVVIPSLPDNPNTFRYLFWLYEAAQEIPVLLDLSRCKILSHSSIVFLIASVIRRNEGQEPIFKFDWATVPLKILRKFNMHFDWLLQDNSINALEQHQIPTRIFSKSDDVLAYLIEDWLQPSWIDLSGELRWRLAGRTYEIFRNTFDHSGQSIVYCCGEHSLRWKRMKLAILDFGVGIPGKVKPFLYRREGRTFPDKTCLKWAMQDGATTTEVSRGIGLGLLSDMVEINNGQLDIYSNGAHAIIKGGKHKVTRFDQPFKGTLVNIMFQCDGDHYSLAHEREYGESFR